MVLLILGLVSVVISLFVLFLSSKLRKGKYDEQNSKVVLEGIRESIEQKIYALNDRLVQSEERWRDVNHLLLSDKKRNRLDIGMEKRLTFYSEFLQANGIAEQDLIIDNRLIFVLTPFSDRYYDEFMIIKSTCEKLGFRCIRGDEKEFKGDIFPEMLRYIAEARIIIANINGRNPNVLYELGVAQAMDKSVILVSQEPNEIPVDIKSQRFLIYSDSNSLVELLRVELSKLL